MRNTAYSWLALHGLLYLLLNTAHTTYPEWHHPQWAAPSQSLINKENASKACPGQSAGGNSSSEVTLSPGDARLY